MEKNKDPKGISLNAKTRTALLIIASIMLLLVILGVADAAYYSNKIHKGVIISEVPLGGKAKDTAVQDIKALAKVLEAKTISIRYEDKAWELKPEEIDFTVDIEKSFDKAFNLGKEGGLFQNIKTRIGLWFASRQLEPAYKYDHKKLDDFIKEIKKDVDIPTKDAAINVVESRAAISNSKNGLEVKRGAFVSKILKALSYKDIKKLSLPVAVTKPDITEDDLSETKKMVKQMLKEQITLRYKTDSWDVSIKQITDWMEFNKVREGDRWTLKPVLNRDEVVSFVEDKTKDWAKEPINADFKIEGDKVVIVPSSDGIKVDSGKAYDDIIKACNSDDKRLVMLSMMTAKPKLTTDDASKMGIKEKVSSFTTTYNPGQASRVHNIRTLAGELDGIILAPGEEFSFNGAIGPRTAAKGYREAPAIVNGRLVPSLGGGVCQVATTLFNTIFFGGFEVVERHNHSFFISHYPTGRDATVSYGGPDLKFKNSYPTHLLIKTEATSSSITITFYSTSQGFEVKYTTAGPSNFKPAGVIREDDPTLPVGTEKVFEEGYSGSEVTVNRTIYKDGKKVKEDKFFSRYRPKKQVVKVGTMIVETPAQETTVTP